MTELGLLLIPLPLPFLPSTPPPPPPPPSSSVLPSYLFFSMDHLAPPAASVLGQYTSLQSEVLV
jgi:hypothetical protein